MVKCRRMKRPQFMSKNWIFLDNESPRGYASSFIARKPLRRSLIFVPVDQWSKKPHLIKKRYSDTMQHRELRSDRGSWFINEFFLKLSLCNKHDTFKAGNKLIILRLLQARLPHQPWHLQLCQATMGRARGDLCGIDPYPVTVSSKHVERKEWWYLLTKPTQNPKPNKNEDHDQERRDLLHSDIPEWLQ